MFQMPQIGTEQQHYCESCARSTTCVFIGVQTFPTRVAEMLKIASVVQQWRCEKCHTTLTLSEAESVA